MPTPECTRRLTKDYKVFQKNPPPYIQAHPDPSNLLEWHFTVDGPPDSPYEGGLYHGKLVFPEDYPFQPPAVYMCTPNGRFKTSGKICLSMSDFHPQEWNPLWSVSSILTGMLSFMLEEHETYGSVRCSDSERRRLARDSLSYNLRNPFWVSLFPEQAATCRERLEKLETEGYKPEKQTVDRTGTDRAGEKDPPGQLFGSLLKSGLLLAVCAGLGFMLWSI